MRIAVGVEYKGTAFSGWQSQSGVRTVQDCVERALGEVANHPVRVVTAGRTDTGVHATGQVAHFDTANARPVRAWTRGVNSRLPGDVRVLWAHDVPDRFHARFSAVERAYRYIIFCSARRPAILGDLCTWVHYDLDVHAMREAAAWLPGERDFSAFRAAGCQSSTPYRNIKQVSLTRSGQWLWLDIRADAFLQHMVRNIAGSLILVGRGEREPDWFGELLRAGDRARAGATAPPQGLYLTEVVYPGKFNLPAPAPPVRFW